jgi:PA14 domain-containing protein
MRVPVPAILLLMLCPCRTVAQEPGSAAQEQDEVPVFGTTVVLPSGLRGEVYNLRPNTTKLPNFGHMKPAGVIYTTSLNIPPREFTTGFPGVTDRFEWFAIDYTGRFWVEKPGAYNFELTSDDGSKLFIDDREVIDNDGAHVVATRWGDAALSGGIHSIRISYFQGRRYRLALILKVKGPGDAAWRVFSTEDFKPPAHPEDWKFGGEKDLEKSSPVKKK